MYLDLNLMKEGFLFTKPDWNASDGDKEIIQSLGLEQGKIVYYSCAKEGNKTVLIKQDYDELPIELVLDDSWFTIKDPINFRVNEMNPVKNFQNF